MPLVATRGAASAQGFGEFAQSGGPVYIEDVFSTWLYTGNGSTQTITNGIDLAGKGGMVWTKERSPNSRNNFIGDSARDNFRNYLYSNLTNSQSGLSGSGFDISSVSSTGYSLGADNYTWNNESGSSQVSWTFRKQPKFFDVVTYTGNGADNRQIAHNLAGTPGCVIIKSTNNAQDWAVAHRGNGTNGRNGLSLNDTSPSSYNTFPATSTTFTVFASASQPNGVTNIFGDGMNQPGYTYVAYLFAHNAGGFGLTGTDNVISCGSFTADGSGGATVNLGYEPQWVMWKRSDGTGDWTLLDNMRGWGQTIAQRLVANTSAAEDSMSGGVGFTPFPTATGFFNGNQGAAFATYIYIAIRRGPMKTPTTGTSVFSPNRWTSATGSTITTNFPVDMQIGRWMGGADNNSVQTRLIGLNTTTTNAAQPLLITNSTAAESTNSSANYGYNSLGFLVGANNTGDGWAVNFRRAPGFFDVVCYTGTGSFQTVSHNLGVVPELVIFKGRGSPATNWITLVSSLSKFGYLNNTLAVGNDPVTYFTTNGSTYAAPTATSLFLNNLNASTYVAYLFASCPGVSKVGSYTGTGALQTINCGFTGGARFVLIKRTDSTGDWFTYDSARGITSGNDPYLLMNSTAAEVTGTNYVDTTSVGFQVTAAAPAGLNANGGTYIFLAIA